MFKNMKLAAKITVGFISVIVIAVAIGGLAIWNMQAVQSQSALLAQEYVPQQTVVGDVQAEFQKVMFDMRGYAFSEDKAYLERGRKAIAATREQLAGAKDLAGRATQLAKLREAVGPIEANIAEYERLVARANAPMAVPKIAWVWAMDRPCASRRNGTKTAQA